MKKHWKKTLVLFACVLAAFAAGGDQPVTPDNTAEILQIASQVQSRYMDITHGDLRGYCLIASKDLQDKLNDVGITSTLEHGHYVEGMNRLDHWWLVVDERILDITSSQFDCDPSVEFVPEAESDHYYEEE